MYDILVLLRYTVDAYSQRKMAADTPFNEKLDEKETALSIPSSTSEVKDEKKMGSGAAYMVRDFGPLIFRPLPHPSPSHM